MREIGVLILKNSGGTAYNSVFAVRFAHPNAFGTSQTRRTMNRNDASLSTFVGTFRFIGGGCAMLQPEDQREEVLQSKGLSEASLWL